MKKSKLILFIGTLVFVPLFILALIFGSLKLYNFLSLQTQNQVYKNQKRHNLNDISVSSNLDNYNFNFSNLKIDAFKNAAYDFLDPQLKKDLNDDFNKFNDDFKLSIQKSIFTDKKIYVLEYVDPYTNLKFRDFSYYINEEKDDIRFFLDKNGLKLLAFYFKKSIPFSNEINDLGSVNINDFDIIQINSRGLYIQNNSSIYLNAYDLIEKGISLEDKVKFLIPTLFHEYFHHFAKFYLKTPTLKQNQKNNYVGVTSTINDEDEGHNHQKFNYWNKHFYDNFVNILNFTRDSNDDRKYFYLNNIDTKYQWFLNDQVVSNVNNKIFDFLTLKDLFYNSNIIDQDSSEESKNAINKVNNYFALNNDNVIFDATLSEFKTSLSTLQYVYDLDELIARENTKSSFIPFANKINKKIFFKEAKDGLYYYLDWFGIFVFRDDNQLVSRSFNNYFDDYYKVFFDAVGKYKQIFYPIQISDKRLKYPNYLFIKSANPTEQYPFLYSQFNFYKLNLDMLGYGKNISSISVKHPEYQFVKANEKVLIDIKDNNQNFIKLNGFLDYNNKYKGFVFFSKNPQNPYIKATFDKKLIFRFNSITHNPLIEKSISDFNLFPQNIYTNNDIFYSYSTKDFINLDLVDISKSISYWDDINNDDEIQENEIISDVKITINNLIDLNSKTINKLDEKHYYSLIEKDNNLYFEKINS
ncbi:hypothetical protein V2E24_00415 [Mycoplasmopsis ciconiae]|uniref:Uncharacterized protein n=1 Tax=Mycoplasmopsis ciconiae TaxID=561067 RepID=A0ABU7MM39_9BACT|nr:hypothetical protein [Mycoplasmopsis ciconiae]